MDGRSVNATIPEGPRPRVLLAGQGVLPSGFGRVLDSLAAHLKAKYEIHQFAVDYRGDAVSPAAGWYVHPNHVLGDPLGTCRLPSLIEEIQPRLLLMLHDPWYFRVHRESLQPFRDRLKVVVYTAVDGALINPAHLEGLDFIDRYVVFTRFGEDTLRRCLEGLRDTCGAGASFPPIHVIPHGVDVATFHPLCGIHDRAAGTRAARTMLFPGDHAVQDAFIVLNGNANHFRKRLDITIEGFAQFARRTTGDVRLWLHMCPDKIGYDTRALAQEHGIGDRLMFSPVPTESPWLSDAGLNTIFNACDVGINTSMGEGWGLVSFEHAATGAAQIVPNHSACAELWRDSAVLLEPVETLVFEPERIERKVVSPGDVAASLERLHQDAEFRQGISRAGYARATDAELQWQRVAQRFDEVFTELLAAPAGPAAIAPPTPSLDASSRP